MSKFLPSGHGGLVLKLCAAGALASLMAGCASDTTRMSDPFSNPFASASNEPVRHTASIGHAIPAGRSPPIMSQALPPRTSSVASTAPLRPQVMTAYNAPVSRETTGSIDPGPIRTAPGAAYGGWTSSGGVPITVGEGESAEMLSKRYGVPANALLETNGLRSSSEIRPGSRLTIPVYNATASRSRAVPQVARAEPVRDNPRREPVRVAEEAPRHAQADRRAERAPQMTARAERQAAAEERAAARARPVAPAKLALAHPVRPIAETPQERRKGLARNAPVALRSEPVRQASVKQVPVGQSAETNGSVRTTPVKSAPVRTAALAPAPAAPALRQAAPAPAAAAVAPTASAAPVADASGNPEFRWPARGRIIQGFKGGNDGINIAVPEGTAVKAAEGGTVAYAGNELKGYGNLVLIRHPNGFVTAYGNNGELDVKRGDQVKRGQVIAKSGQSGNVASPQLHFELRKGSTPVDPTSYLAGL